MFEKLCNPLNIDALILSIVHNARSPWCSDVLSILISAAFKSKSYGNDEVEWNQMISSTDLINISLISVMRMLLITS